ncbi:phosphatase PAP2 family protein [Alicyclobacillus acidoterrestris]|uniref:Phosphatase PAP2 family protein n=1 Tax=Alicyclobacillus acidoterrestris (strain ATCC 49025 / DSM 3922 / CIP 106132 / NCIMB 13137 / GD3B) TaxID=1356854 RepID=T0C5P0_ALIAG|nr:phosphatase PAP2 family protein [Alicyclobacillus acidoterrestris]EPZ48299.1 hypothetical protein N007_00840 [Alicyclobacillus acidoterrestris ATCC 49025]UNO50392.1 phosphatase PAP2 family protein [Alicyclobacillus acidoterrestris]
MGLTDWLWRGFSLADAVVTRRLEKLWITTPWLNALMIIAAKYTPIVMLAILVIAAANIVEVTTAEVSFVSVASSIVAALLIRALHEPVSRLTNRPRPFDTEPFEPLLEHERGESFPSNHAGGSMALACGALHLPFYPWLLLVLAILLCFSRIYCGLHHLSDVLVGALGGATCGVVCAFAGYAVVAHA